MSVESLLVVAFLIVLSLLQWFARVLRTGRPERSDRPAVSPPHRQRASVPTPAVPQPALPARHPPAERLGAGERIRVSRLGQPGAPAVPMGEGDRPSRARRVFALGNAADLRRAMMLVAILGPCKALVGPSNGPEQIRTPPTPLTGRATHP